MATFKVGQRVRKVAMNQRDDWMQVVPIGMEGVITAIGDPLGDGREYTVNYGSRFDGDGHAAMGWQLAPLTDPGVEAFLESLKRLGREPRIDMPQVIQEHS